MKRSFSEQIFKKEVLALTSIRLNGILITLRTPGTQKFSKPKFRNLREEKWETNQLSPTQKMNGNEEKIQKKLRAQFLVPKQELIYFLTKKVLRRLQCSKLNILLFTLSEKIEISSFCRMSLRG